MGLSFAQIQQAYEREAANAGPVTRADEIPLGYEHITAEWLTAVLTARSSSDVKVTGFRLSEPDEGTSSRRRIYLEYNEAGEADGLPKSVFCKSTHHLENRYIIGMNGGIEAEVTFFDKVRERLDLIAPDCVHAAFNPDSLNSIVILRDMEGEVEFCNYDTPLTEELARSQMRGLATLHAAFYESPELDTTLGAWNTWEDYFRITAEEAGFELACKRGFSEAREVIPPALFRHEAAIWPATLDAIALHAKLPRTLVHGDPHLKNWYIAGPDSMGMNDWQCSCKGHLSRDLSYCISAALTVEQRRAWERDLVGYYVDLMREKGVTTIDFDEVWLSYRAQMFGALAWWTGTLGQPPEAPEMQPRDASMAFIERMTHAMDDLDSLGAVAEYA